MKTVAEFAKEAGKSTTSVYRMLNTVERETEKCLTVLNGNVKQITDEGLEILRDRFGTVEQPVQQTSNTVEQPLNDIEHPNGRIEDLQKTISILEKQLEIKDQQIKEKDDQIREIIQTTKQQQSLSLADRGFKPLMLEDGQVEWTPPADDKKKRPFFDRLFNRDKAD